VLVLAVAGYLALRLAPLSPAMQTALTESIYCLTLALATGATLVAGLRSQGHEHRFWMRFALILGSLFAAQVYWTWATVVTLSGGGELFAVDMVMDIVAMVIFVSLVWTLTDIADGTTLGKVRYFVDVVSGALIATIVIFVFVIAPWMAPYGVPTLTMIANAMFPVFGLLVAMWTLSNLFGFDPARWSAWERPMVAGLLLFSAGALLYPVVYMSTEFWHDVTAVVTAELLWMTGTYLIGVGAVYRLTSAVRYWGVRPMPPVTSRHPVASSLVPVGVAVAALIAFAVITFALPPGDPVRGAVVVSSVLVAVLVVLRTGLSTIRAGRLRVAAGLDPLTGLRNHRGFQERLAALRESAEAAGEPLAVIVVDLDDFEHVNRVFGYPEGDRLITAAARAVAAASDRDEVASRLGGDEFGLVLSGADEDWARLVADRLLASLRRVTDPSGAPLRASAGVASFPGAAPSYGDTLDAADQALLSAKLAGKDRSVTWSPQETALREHADLEHRALAQSYLAALRTTASAMDARLPHRREHSRNVASMALRLALKAGLDEQTARLVETAGLLHDIGKVGVPDAALTDDLRAMSDADRERFEEHPGLGATIVASAGLPIVAQWVHAHHERWDGRGFPDGVVAEDIPLGARIVAVADGYDLVSGRIAREGTPASRGAVAEAMRSGMGTTYDPVVVLHLLSVLAEGGETP
jgi:diguanylate cyclase (GGDEF)-like protein/putative nucleotidyltransferase with HDIG domain